MTYVNPTTASSAVTVTSPQAASTTSSASLMPPATMGGDVGDALSLMLRVSTELGSARTESNKDQIHQAHEARKAEIKQEIEAKRDEDEARKHSSGGFFGAVKHLAHTYAKDLVSLRPENVVAPGIGAFAKDLFSDPATARDLKQIFSSPAMKWVGVAAAVAACVATGGAGAPFAFALAGAIMTSASAAQEQFHVMGHSKWAQWTSTGLAVGGGACTVVATCGASGAGWQSTVKGATNVGSGVMAAGSGAGEIAAARFDKKADDAHADALEAQQRAARADRLIENIIQFLQEDSDSQRKETSHVQKAMEAHSATLVAATSMRV